MNEILDIYLIRHSRSDQGTEGRLSVPGLQLIWPTLELPWRDNRPCISCIPPGTYPLSWRISRKYKAFHIRNVPRRSFILIHSGNFAGDPEKGFYTHVQGCVLLGTRMGYLKGQRAVLASRAAVRRFNTAMRGRQIRITIKEEINA